MKNLKIQLDGSGGSTKGVFIYEVWKRIVSTYKIAPSVYSVNSISSILVLPFILGKFDEIDEIFYNVKLRSIFGRSPYFKIPLIDSYLPTPRALFNALMGRISLGDMDNLRKSLESLVSEEEFYSIFKGNDIKVYAATTKISDKSAVIWPIHTMRYKDAIDAIMASASILPFVEPIKVYNEYYVDGGYRNHTCGHVVAKQEKPSVLISVLSIPRDMEGLTGEPLCNIIDSAEWVADVFSRNTSIDDQLDQDELLKCGDIGKLHRFYAPDVLEGYYDVDRDRLKKLGGAGKMIDISELKYLV